MLKVGAKRPKIILTDNMLEAMAKNCGKAIVELTQSDLDSFVNMAVVKHAVNIIGKYKAIENLAKTIR